MTDWTRTSLNGSEPTRPAVSISLDLDIGWHALLIPSCQLIQSDRLSGGWDLAADWYEGTDCLYVPCSHYAPSNHNVVASVAVIMTGDTNKKYMTRHEYTSIY